MIQAKIELEVGRGWVINWYEAGVVISSHGMFDTRDEAVATLLSEYGEVVA